MTAVGLGIDVVGVEGFAAQLADEASGFAEMTFTERERRAAAGDPEVRALRLAARFAAKEAFIKAWGAARAGRAPDVGTVDMREIEVVDDGYGRPSLSLHGAVAASVARLETDLGRRVQAMVSLSHDGPAAAAVVLLSLG
ncbi:MAG: 4'-phosphopantetheinyl transferase superfamily protein [Thermoleophilia bacterium]